VTDPASDPVGVVRSTYLRNEETPIQSALNLAATGEVELVESARPGLLGLEGFSHVWLLTWLDRPVDPWTPVPLVQVPFLLRPTGEQKGVFATRSPRRPTPIGLSLVSLVSLSDTGFTFAGVDLMDGTPVLDIKPYVAAFDRPQGEVRSGWFDEVDPESGTRPMDLGSPGG
jgi:tRNA-Thr(GGU) m(6)t(6)A37 methyltransferase TsaA